MVTANDLLAQIEGVEDRVCEIDLITRKINIPSSIVALGVEHDDDVKRLYFRVPRMYGDVDMSAFNIRINYMNAANEGDIYRVTDKLVDGDIITFSWRVGPHAFAVKGNVNFIVCMKGTDPSDTANLRELNTTVASLPVLEGLEVDAAPLEGDLQDILEQLETLTADKIASIKDEGETQIKQLQQKSEEEQTNIRGTADYIRSTFGDDYETTVKMYRTRANAIVQTVEGEDIAVKDASDDYLRGLRIFGKSTQVSTTGKNLFDSNPALVRLIDKTTRPQYGYEVTLEPGTYTISARQKGASTTYIYASVYNGTTMGDNLYLVIPNDVRTVTVTMSEGDTLCLFNASDYNTTVGNENTTKVLFATHQVQIEQGTVATDYEPYSGGLTSPSPDYSQAIDSVSNPTLSIHCKNLVRTGYSKTDTYEGMNIVITKGTSEVSLNGTTIKPYGYAISQGTYLAPGKYTMSIHGLNNADKAYLMNVETRLLVCDNVRTGSPVTFEVTDAGIYRIDFTFTKETTYTNATVSFQIEAGETATEYEPIVPFETLSLNRTLPGIPVTSGGNYTDQNGQQWICDEVDFERGVYVQRTKTVELDGSDKEGWALYNNNEKQGLSFVYYAYDGLMSFHSSLCDRYRNVDGCWGESYYGTKGIYSDHNTAPGRYFRPPNDSVNTLETWKAWLAENPLTFMYVLKTSIETPLTDAELAAYAALHSNYPNTTVVNDSGAHMELKYNADTATFFTRSRASDEQVQAAVDTWLEAHFSSAEGVSF